MSRLLLMCLSEINPQRPAGSTAEFRKLSFPRRQSHHWNFHRQILLPSWRWLEPGTTQNADNRWYKGFFICCGVAQYTETKWRSGYAHHSHIDWMSNTHTIYLFQWRQYIGQFSMYKTREQKQTNKKKNVIIKEENEPTIFIYRHNFPIHWLCKAILKWHPIKMLLIMFPFGCRQATLSEQSPVLLRTNDGRWSFYGVFFF